jgi:hypothetical protein
VPERPPELRMTPGFERCGSRRVLRGSHHENEPPVTSSDRDNEVPSAWDSHWLRERISKGSKDPEARICSNFPMGRVGLEPTTLGLKVRPEWMQVAVGNRKYLQRASIRAARICSGLRSAETNSYSQSYSRARDPSGASSRYRCQFATRLSLHLPIVECQWRVVRAEGREVIATTLR